MNRCYVCDLPLENYIDNTSANHEEHIIPQAIGGQLTMQGALCKECGGEKYLGGKIDKPFCDIFLLITERLDLKRDRKTKPVSLKGKFTLLENNESMEVSLKENVLIHRKPEYKIDHEKKTVFIFASKDAAKDFRKKVEKELKMQAEDCSGYEIRIVTDLYSLNEFIGILELPFNLSNKVFEAGYVKIAIEFALYQGVDIESLKHLVDKESRLIKSENALVIPYYPIIEVEETIEYLRSSLDENFMSHSLILFSQRQIEESGEETKRLFCFIELFGTFQYFVLLSDSYVGSNIEPVTYSQRIIKDRAAMIDIEGLSPKDLSIYIRELGLSIADVKGNSYNEVKKSIEHAYKSKNKYIFDYSANIKEVVDRILFNLMHEENDQLIKLIPEIVSHFYWNVDEDEFHITFFRSRFVRDQLVFSILPEIEELYQTDPEKFRLYTYFKFKELEDFINENRNRA